MNSATSFRTTRTNHLAHKKNKAAPEAPKIRVVDRVSTLLFDLYHYLEQNGASWWVPEHAPGPSSQVLPGCRGRHPLGSKKGFAWDGSIKSLLFFLHLPLLPLSLTPLLHPPPQKWGWRGGGGGREVGWWGEESVWRRGTRRSVQAYVWEGLPGCRTQKLYWVILHTRD